MSPVSDQLKFTAVFGSVASGKATITSETDLQLVGELSFAATIKLPVPANSFSGNFITVVTYSQST
ncbi:hypothetical protein A5320_17820 [Rheinheimera sp. SA_1]|nr:hypothetical protein A5320_17820 [Rheinheimera sp. SA_1]